MKHYNYNVLWILVKKGGGNMSFAKNMKLILTILSISAIAVSCNKKEEVVVEEPKVVETVEPQPEEVEPVEEQKYVGNKDYTGYIDKYYIEMNINFDGENIKGDYCYGEYYFNDIETISFTGKYNDPNIEFTTEDGTETFIGTVDGAKITGTWKKGDTTLDFEIESVDGLGIGEVVDFEKLLYIYKDDYEVVEFTENYNTADLVLKSLTGPSEGEIIHATMYDYSDFRELQPHQFENMVQEKYSKYTRMTEYDFLELKGDDEIGALWGMYDFTENETSKHVLLYDKYKCIIEYDTEVFLGVEYKNVSKNRTYIQYFENKDLYAIKQSVRYNESGDMEYNGFDIYKEYSEYVQTFYSDAPDYVGEIEPEGYGDWNAKFTVKENNSRKEIFATEEGELDLANFGAGSVSFLDVNNDGHIDIDVSTGGTMNMTHNLYLGNWDTGTFELVEFEGFDMLSFYEVKDGYIENYVRESASGGINQILVWNGNKLVLESEEVYQAEQ